MKKLLILFLCLGMLTPAFPVLAEDYAHRNDIFTYTVSGENATITNVEDIRSSVTVPETLDGYTVTKLGKGAFGGSTVTKHIDIPDTVTEIADFCFAYSHSLQSVTLPDSITSIPEGAFYHCEQLWAITVPDTVKTIDNYAFGRCPSLVAVTLPATLVSIGEDAFASNSDALRLYSKTNSYAYNYALEKNITFEEYISVVVNGEKIIFDQPCITDKENYRTLVPVRAVMEALGATVCWNNARNAASIEMDDTIILIRSGNPYMLVNESIRYMSSLPIEYNNRLLIPIRDLIVALGGTVGWDEEEKIVTVSFNENTPSTQDKSPTQASEGSSHPSKGQLLQG